jgi:hypothetical protein
LPVDRGAHRLGIAWPVDPFALQRRLAERVVEDHRPPENDVPGEPRDARRADVVTLVVRPVRDPAAVRDLPDVEP